MATVINKARPEEGTDPTYDAPNRKLAATPIGATAPLYMGEIVINTTDGTLYKAVGAGVNGWEQLQATKS